MSISTGRALRGTRDLAGPGVVRVWTHSGCSTEHHSRLTARNCWVGPQPVRMFRAETVTGPVSRVPAPPAQPALAAVTDWLRRCRRA